MDLLAHLFDLKKPDLRKPSGEIKTTGELIAEVTDGANLVDGRQTWEYIAQQRNDLQRMMQCCDAELNTMQIAGVVAAPYYFERVAILLRRAKKFEQEIEHCERYISAVQAFYIANGSNGVADVRKGPRFAAIVKRLAKARALQQRGK